MDADAVRQLARHGDVPQRRDLAENLGTLRLEVDLGEIGADAQSEVLGEDVGLDHSPRDDRDLLGHVGEDAGFEAERAQLFVADRQPDEQGGRRDEAEDEPEAAAPPMCNLVFPHRS